MTDHWDEFSKSLARPLPRRESLRRLGIALAGTVLSPLGLQTAFGGHHSKPQTDLCKSFCKCRNKKQQDQCLKACSACGKDPSRLRGSCGSYFCCGAGQTSCGNYCADLGNDPYNCGACGNVCGGPNPSCYQGACSQCTPSCPEGWCGGDGCGGACACPSGMYCESDGWCYNGCASGLSLCDGQCVDVLFDAGNCGGCGQACPTGHVCSAGACCNPTISDCGSDPCGFPFILCGGVCVDPTTDPFNCGACFQQCAPNEVCAGGFCQGFGGDAGW